MYPCAPSLQCPVTCGGGVRSRNVTCAVAPKKTCDLATKPRSRSLCALQSCPNSSLRRRPGPPPKYRRVYPPKSDPPQHPVSSTRAPTSTTATAEPTTRLTLRKETAPIPTTTSLLTPKITGPDLVDTDDYDFNNIVRKKEDAVHKGGNHRHTTMETETIEEREDEEEGSTPDVLMSTPGNGHWTDRTREEEEIIDLDVGTTAASRHNNHVKSTSPMPHIITATLQTSPPTTHTSRAPTSTSSFIPLTSARMFEKTTHRSASTSPPHSRWTHRAPLTTLKGQTGLHTTRAPSTAARKPVTTATAPTVKVLKVKKPVSPKKSSSAPHAKKPSSRSKGSRSKSQNQQPELPRSSTTGDQSNLMAREPVSKDVWVVGNWSEVTRHFLYYIHIILKQ